MSVDQDAIDAYFDSLPKLPPNNKYANDPASFVENLNKAVLTHPFFLVAVKLLEGCCSDAATVAAVAISEHFRQKMQVGYIGHFKFNPAEEKYTSSMASILQGNMYGASTEMTWCEQDVIGHSSAKMGALLIAFDKRTNEIPACIIEVGFGCDDKLAQLSSYALLALQEQACLFPGLLCIELLINQNSGVINKIRVWAMALLANKELGRVLIANFDERDNICSVEDFLSRTLTATVGAAPYNISCEQSFWASFRDLWIEYNDSVVIIDRRVPGKWRVWKRFLTGEGLLRRHEAYEILLPEFLMEYKSMEMIVISYKYIKGEFIACNVKQFLFILKHLRRLHETYAGHGDILFRNVVFASEPADSSLIDLDWCPGGYYSPGLIIDVNDGERHPDVVAAFENNEVSLAIEKKHDFFALASIMKLHETIPKAKSEWQGAIDSLMAAASCCERDVSIHLTQCENVLAALNNTELTCLVTVA